MGEFRDMRVLGFWRWVYLHFFYRVHMRWLHKRGRHQWKHLDPVPRQHDMPNGFMRCDWCGETKEKSA